MASEITVARESRVNSINALNGGRGNKYFTPTGRAAKGYRELLRANARVKALEGQRPKQGADEPYGHYLEREKQWQVEYDRAFAERRELMDKRGF